MALEIPVLLGSVREGRRSEHVARFVHGRLAARPGITSTFLDPRDYPLGNLVQREYEMASRPEAIARYVDIVSRADGFVIVTPEYNYGIPGALKNALDITFKPWNRKPFGMVACGGISGGMRAIDMLRQVISGLEAIPVPAHVPIHHVGKTFGPGGPLVDAGEWAKRIDRFLDEVIWYANALKPAREAHTATT